jgi:hypothetical protein
MEVKREPVEVEIFAAALDYATGKRVDGTICTWIRMRVFVDSAPNSTWHEYDRDPKESVEDAVSRHLAANEIPVRGIKGSVARIDTKAIDLSEYSEYPAPEDGISIRTFLTVEGTENDLFGPDSVWNVKLGSKTISEWYRELASIV